VPTRDLRKGLRDVAANSESGLPDLDWSDHPMLGEKTLANAQLNYLHIQARAIEQALKERRHANVSVTRGTPGAYEVLRFWVGFLLDYARGSAYAEHCLYSIDVGESAVLPAISLEQAQDQLRRLLEVYLQGQLTPFPFFLNAAMHYRKKPEDSAGVEQAMLGKGDVVGQGHGPRADMDDPSHALVWRGRVPAAHKLYPLWTTVLGVMPDSLFHKPKKAKSA
jgi:exonuclease V gamma subunit